MVPLGKRFQLARKRQNYTLEQVSKALKIRVEFLKALEAGEYSNLPSSAYVHGFVGNYAEFLGLPKAETIAMFRREFDETNNYGVLPQGLTRSSEFKVKRIQVKRTVFLLLALLLLIGGYIGYQYRFAFLNPQLTVYTPKEHEIMKTNQTSVSGKSDPNATVFVNNSVVSLDENGNFTKKIDLFAGKTIIQVTATNRFGRKSTIERLIEVKP